MRKVQVGIDLGTTNTLACCRVKGKMKLIKFRGSQILPSVLYVEKKDDGTIVETVGKSAKIKGMGDPENYIHSAKTYIGLTGDNKKIWNCHGKSYTPTDVAEKILSEVHKKVRETYSLEKDDIVQAVITIPAYFTSTQSDETKRAGERAGMEVLRIITEPVAAAVSVAEDVEGKIFVVDLGGGTFDVSVLNVSNEKYSTLEIGGERRLGGDDFDEKLMEFFLKYIEDDLDIDLSSLAASGLDYEVYYGMMSKIRSGAIELKEGLSEDDEYDLEIPKLFTYGPDNKSYDFSITMDREEFNNICSELFERIMNVIKTIVEKSNKFTKDEIKSIYLVGGSCYIPKVQEDVEKYFGISANSEQDRVTQVAIGAGKIADAWDGFSPEQDRIDPFEDKLQDIISHSMGIEVVNEKNERVYSELLAEGSFYPCNHMEKYKTSYDNQEEVIINVYEKTNKFASNSFENNPNDFDFYGSFVLDGIEKAPAGEIPIAVTFEYDQSRTLHVTAEDTKNNNKKKVTLHKGELIDKSSKVVSTDFYLLLDVSGSMYGSRINEAKNACINLIQETLDLNIHRLGIITFGSRVQMISNLTQNKDKLIAAVKNVISNGSTNMSDAIKLAYDSYDNNKSNKAIILITDGQPDNYELTHYIANKAKSHGVSIATIGVHDADETFLRRISGDTNLTFMVNNISKLSETFGEAVVNLLRK